MAKKKKKPYNVYKFIHEVTEIYNILSKWTDKEAEEYKVFKHGLIENFALKINGWYLSLKRTNTIRQTTGEMKRFADKQGYNPGPTELVKMIYNFYGYWWMNKKRGVDIDYFDNIWKHYCIKKYGGIVDDKLEYV